MTTLDRHCGRQVGRAWRPARADLPDELYRSTNILTPNEALAEGRPLREALRWAAAGALSVTRRGAQPSMPTRAEVEALWQTQPPGGSEPPGG